MPANNPPSPRPSRPLRGLVRLLLRLRRRQLQAEQAADQAAKPDDKKVG